MHPLNIEAYRKGRRARIEGKPKHIEHPSPAWRESWYAGWEDQARHAADKGDLEQAS